MIANVEFHHAAAQFGQPLGLRGHAHAVVLDELADTGVDFLDRTRNLPQPLVGQDENVAQRHVRDVSGRRNWVNARHTAVIGTSGAARRG